MVLSQSVSFRSLRHSLWPGQDDKLAKMRWEVRSLSVTCHLEDLESKFLHINSEISVPNVVALTPPFFPIHEKSMGGGAVITSPVLARVNGAPTSKVIIRNYAHFVCLPGKYITESLSRIKETTPTAVLNPS